MIKTMNYGIKFIALISFLCCLAVDQPDQRFPTVVTLTNVSSLQMCVILCTLSQWQSFHLPWLHTRSASGYTLWQKIVESIRRIHARGAAQEGTCWMNGFPFSIHRGKGKKAHLTSLPSGHTTFKQHCCNVAVQRCLNVTFWFQNWTPFNITVMFLP